MEINITKLIENEDSIFSTTGSIAELGNNAAKITWNNALKLANETKLLDAEAIAELKIWFKTFGAWTKEEILNWTDQEVEALFIQSVNFELIEDPDQNFNTGRIFKSEDNQYYFYVGE